MDILGAEATSAEQLQTMFSEIERAYDDAALQAFTEGDVGTRELAARLKGELIGMKRVATVLGYELVENSTAPW